MGEANALMIHGRYLLRDSAVRAARCVVWIIVVLAFCYLSARSVGAAQYVPPGYSTGVETTTDKTDVSEVDGTSDPNLIQKVMSAEKQKLELAGSGSGPWYLPFVSWEISLDWSADWRAKRALAEQRVGEVWDKLSDIDFSERFPFTIFTRIGEGLDGMNGSGMLSSWSTSFDLGGHQVLVQIPSVLVEVFATLRTVMGWCILVFGLWALAHKFLSFSGG